MWGTGFKTDVYIKRLTFKTKEDLLDKIKEVNEDIEELKTFLCMYATATPVDIVEEGHSPIQYILTKMNGRLEEYNTAVLLQRDLEDLLEYVEENGIKDLSTLNDLD